MDRDKAGKLYVEVEVEVVGIRIEVWLFNPISITSIARCIVCTFLVLSIVIDSY